MKYLILLLASLLLPNMGLSQNLCDVKQCIFQVVNNTELANKVNQKYKSNEIYLGSTFVSYDDSDSLLSLINFIELCTMKLKFTEQPSFEFNQVLRIANFKILEDSSSLIVRTYTNYLDTIPDLTMQVSLVKKNNVWEIYHYTFYDGDFIKKSERNEKLDPSKDYIPILQERASRMSQAYRNADKDKSWENCDCY